MPSSLLSFITIFMRLQLFFCSCFEWAGVQGHRVVCLAQCCGSWCLLQQLGLLDPAAPIATAAAASHSGTVKVTANSYPPESCPHGGTYHHTLEISIEVPNFDSDKLAILVSVPKMYYKGRLYILWYCIVLFLLKWLRFVFAQVTQ